MRSAILPAFTSLLAIPMLLIRRKPHGQPYTDIEGREWVRFSWPSKANGGDGFGGDGFGGDGGGSGGGDGGGCGGDGGCG